MGAKALEKIGLPPDQVAPPVAEQMMPDVVGQLVQMYTVYIDSTVTERLARSFGGLYRYRGHSPKVPEWEAEDAEAKATTR